MRQPGGGIEVGVERIARWPKADDAEIDQCAGEAQVARDRAMFAGG